RSAARAGRIRSRLVRVRRCEIFGDAGWTGFRARIRLPSRRRVRPAGRSRSAARVVDEKNGGAARRLPRTLQAGIMTSLVVQKVGRALVRKADSLYGRMFTDFAATVDAMTERPFELHLELTNLCNANCVFCPYQFQT